MAFDDNVTRMMPAQATSIKKKKCSFSSVTMVILIPTRKEYDSLTTDLWYSKQDYQRCLQSALHEIRSYARDRKCDVSVAKYELYQADIGTNFTDYELSSPHCLDSASFGVTSWNDHIKGKQSITTNRINLNATSDDMCSSSVLFGTDSNISFFKPRHVMAMLTIPVLGFFYMLK